MKEFIVNLDENQIFVFGSNLAGKHGRGAALTALRKFGAKHGQASGLMGKSYGIPTKDRNLNVLSLEQIENHIRRFLKFAKENQDLTFFSYRNWLWFSRVQTKTNCSIILQI